MVGWSENNELQRTWKEPVLLESSQNPHICLTNLMKVTTDFSHDSLCSLRDSNWAPPEYKSEASLLAPARNNPRRGVSTSDEVCALHYHGKVQVLVEESALETFCALRIIYALSEIEFEQSWREPRALATQLQPVPQHLCSTCLNDTCVSPSSWRCWM
jgi:hypothetical protein